MHSLSMKGHKVGIFMTPSDILAMDMLLDALIRSIKHLMGKEENLGLHRVHLYVRPSYMVSHLHPVNEGVRLAYI